MIYGGKDLWLRKDFSFSCDQPLAIYRLFNVQWLCMKSIGKLNGWLSIIIGCQTVYSCSEHMQASSTVGKASNVQFYCAPQWYPVVCIDTHMNNYYLLLV